MGDQVQFEAGCPPWAPTDDSQVVREYDHYSAPLAGVLEQRGHLFFFWNLVGGDRAEGIWAYRLIEPADVHRLDDLTTPQELQQEAARILDARPVTVAVSLERDDGDVVAMGMVVEHPPGSSYEDFVREARKSVDDFLRAGAELVDL